MTDQQVRPPERAMAIVAARAAGRAAGENFPVALRVLPRAARADLMHVYNFARFVDDIGDETPGDRGSLLDVIVSQLCAGDGSIGVAPVTGLLPVLRRHAIPVAVPLDLVEANRVDQRVHRYADFDALLDYCRLSAAPVGRMVLHIAGAVTPQNLADSDRVCAALQVLEHCQDVGEDARAGRVYLPADDLTVLGVTDADLLAASTRPAVRSAVARQVDRAEALLAAGPDLVRRLSGWSRIAVAGYVAGGRVTADALRRCDFDVLGRSVRPSRWRTARVATRLAVGV